jgi:sugar phosphate isomerase/epimerase
VLQSGLVSITFRKLTPEEVVALVRQAGLRGIEWGGDIHVPHGDLGRAREVRELTVEAGLTIPAYGSYYRAGHSEDAGLPFSKVLDSALELGAPIIRIWAGAAGSETTGEEARWHIVSDLKRIADLAGKAGVRIAAEFHVGTLNDTNTWASQLLLEVNHPNFYSYWQPLSGMSDEVCIEGLTALSPHLAHVHVFQWRTPQDRQPLAEGAERWTNFLHLAASAPGDRYAMLEFVQGDAPENFMRDAAVLRELLAATEHSL